MAYRALTRAEIEQIISEPPVPILFQSDFFPMLTEPRYQTVRYRGALNRVDYERPDTFYELGPESPSDCVWMVPA